MTMPFLLPAAATRKNTRHLFSGKNISFAALLACVFWAFARGFYPPNIWSSNYWLINYFDGFHRRALLGSFLYPFGDLRLNYWFVASIQIVVSAALLVLVLAKLRTLQKQQNYMYVYLAVCLFCLSTYGAFFFGSVGYVEHVMYLLIFLSFQAKGQVSRVLLAVATVLVHEMSIFTCLPLWFAIEYTYFGRKKTAVAGAILGSGVFACIYFFFQTASVEAIVRYKQFIAMALYNARLDYVTDVFQEGFTGAGFRWSSHYGGVPEFADGSGILCIALLAATIIAALSLAKSIGKLNALIAFAATLSPWVMGFFGADINRWMFLACVNAAVMQTIFSGSMGRKELGIQCVMLACGLLLSNVWLFDGRQYRAADEAMRFILHFGTSMKAALI